MHAAAAADGRSGRAAQGADLRLLVRPLPRRHHPDPRHRRRDPGRHEDPADGQGPGVRGRAGRRVLAQAGRRSSELGVGEVGFIFAGIKTVTDAQIGDTITEAARPTARGVPRLQGQQADGLRRALSGRRQRVPAAARRAREAAAERRLVLLRAGDVGGARLRLPLRLPRPAAHGDRPGAARARVRHGPDHDRAGRPLPRDDDRRRGAGDRQPVEAARYRADREDRGAGHHRDDADAVRARRRHPAALPGEARRAEGDRVPRRRTACWSPTSCRSTRSCSTSTIG